MIARRAIFITMAVLAAVSVARSGHELPVYPSYYPHEIEIAALTPQRAAEQMRAGKLHAYIGGTPDFSDTPLKSIGFVESLGAFIVVRLNPSSPLTKDEASACAAVGTIVREMAARAGADGGFVAHPYPVTPWHGDYLLHADLAEAARTRLVGSATAPSAGDGLKVRVEGALAERLVRPEWRVGEGAWDVAIGEVGARELVQSSAPIMNGWLGPRWTRSGWFHAHRLLSGFLSEPQHKARVDADLARLTSGEIEDAADRANLERDLVGALTAGCRALVAGYNVKREYFSTDFSSGIENLSYDALEGLSSPMFLRTVKLKDFPWNGWLHLAVETPSAAAWNPIGGFGDAFGRLMWFASGDPAAIPSPYDHTWILNRISEVQLTTTTP
jgi:hypothetical protein